MKKAAVLCLCLAAAAAAEGQYRGRLMTVKDILGGLPQKDRTEFMSGMRLINGRVASMNYATLKKRGFSGAKTDSILKAFESSAADAESFVPAGGKTLSDMREVMRGVPPAAAADFLDSLTLLDGGFVSARTALLERSVPPSKYGEILKVVMPLARSGPALLRNASCEAAAEEDGGPVQRGCSYNEGYTCNQALCR